jgi:hypothetical protein
MRAVHLCLSVGETRGCKGDDVRSVGVSLNNKSRGGE